MDVTDETKNQIEAELKAAHITIKGSPKLKPELHGPPIRERRATAQKYHEILNNSEKICDFRQGVGHAFPVKSGAC